MGEDKTGERKGDSAQPGVAKGPKTKPAVHPDRDPDRDVDRARRKLLTTLVYAAPLVVSSVIVKPAHAQLASCAPASCRPGGGPCGPSGCPPSGGACGPANCSPRG